MPGAQRYAELYLGGASFDPILDACADGSAYQNAMRNSDAQNARIEHDRALARVMAGVLKDDTELFKLFSDSEAFAKWLSDTNFTATYAAA